MNRADLRAQSETVGVILLAAVFLVAAATVGTVVVDDATPDDEPLIHADFETDDTDLALVHLGGDTVPNDDIDIVVETNGTVTRLDLGPDDESFAPGDRRRFEDVLDPDAAASARLVHRPSGATFGRTAIAAAEPGTADDESSDGTGSLEGTVSGDGAMSIRASGASLAVRQSVVPIDGAGVTVTRDGETVERVTTAAGGGYRLDGLDAGAYEVTADAEGFTPATATGSVEPNGTTTVDLTLEPFAPAEFLVRIDDVDAAVDPGEVVTVTATVENAGDDADIQTVELMAVDAVDSETVALDGGEAETVTFDWATTTDDVGERELAVASGNDTATTSVEILDGDRDEVAYLNRPGTETAVDETYTAAELAELRGVEGHLVVFDDVRVDASIGVDADRITVEEGVSVIAASVSLDADGDVVLAGSTIDTSSSFFRTAGDVTIRGDRVVASDASVTARGSGPLTAPGDVTVSASDRLAAQGTRLTATHDGFLTAEGGDVTVRSDGNVDLTNGDIDASASALFGGDPGAIVVDLTSSSTLTVTGTTFDPEPAIEPSGVEMIE